MENLLDFPTGEKPGSHHDPVIRATAYEVYGVRAGRNMPETIRLMLEMGYDVPQSTLYDWRQRDRWDERLDLENAERQQHLIDLHVDRLRVAAPESVTYLSQVVAGKAAGDPQRVAAAKAIIAENRSLILAAVQQQAKNPSARPVLPAASLSKLEEMSNEELLAYEEHLRSVGH